MLPCSPWPAHAGARDLDSEIGTLHTSPVVDLNFVDVANGALALTHRPKLKDLPRWAEAGATHVVTLLASHEGAEMVGSAVARAGLAWIWCPLANARVPDDAPADDLRTRLSQTLIELDNGARVVIHCSAGIHRTGMFGYALLRLAGTSPSEARQTLHRLRPLLAEGVGSERLAWGDALVQTSPSRMKRSQD